MLQVLDVVLVVEFCSVSIKWTGLLKCHLKRGGATFNAIRLTFPIVIIIDCKCPIGKALVN